MRCMRILIASLALLLLAPASCKKYDKTDDPELPGEGTKGRDPATAPAAKPVPPPKKVLKPEELGTCKLSATGAITKEQTSPGGRAATNVTYWMSQEEKNSLMGSDGFVVNCHGPDMKFSLLPSGKKDSMPFAPKKYTIAKSGNDANVMVLFGKATLDATGTVDVTAFDAHHIAGTIDLKGKLVPGGGEVKLTGSFDLICPGFGACAN
jgi:hypothetical protein